MYPWDPPKVGVSELVLKELEDDLWNLLYEVVLKFVEPFYSRQSSPANPPELYIIEDEPLVPQDYLSLLNE